MSEQGVKIVPDGRWLAQHRDHLTALQTEYAATIRLIDEVMQGPAGDVSNAYLEWLHARVATISSAIKGAELHLAELQAEQIAYLNEWHARETPK